MIINVTYGGSALGAARYIQGAAKENGRDVPGTEERATLLGSEGFGFPVQTQDDVRLALTVLRRDVELQASNTKPVENTVIHASMSWPPGYEPSREEMLEASEHLAKAWGMEEHRRISWSHEDTKHRHTHTLFGSIHPDTGYVHHDHELNDRAQRAAIDWERKHGIPPTRQKDHDKAGAAEASDHVRTMALSKNTDGSISRRSLDRALSLGGWFGRDKAAQRKEFIAKGALTRFPAQEFAYSSKPLAEEKTGYIQENRKSASNLTRAYDREAKERERGVARLYEDHSFEKTSKPPTQEERQTSMGINDILDWPWKRAGEIIRDKWQDWRDERNYRGHVKELDKAVQAAEKKERANRDFGKEVEEKGWNDPGVKRQWEKKYGHKREEKREPSFPQQAQESQLSKWYKDQMAKPRPERDVPLPPRRLSPEEQRLKNLETQRERHEKEEGRKIERDKIPPWRKDEQRSEQWRQQKEQERDERNSVPMPKLNPGKDRVYRPQQSHEPPALPRPREVPMPKIESRDHAPQARETKWDRGFREREREEKGERRFQDGIDKATNPKETPVRDRNKDTRTPQQIAQDERGMIGKEIPANSPAIEDRDRQRAQDYFRDEEPMAREPGARDEKAYRYVPTPPGQEKPRSWNPVGRIYERLDRLDPPTPAQTRDDINASGSAPQSFQQQLDESLGKIKVPKREIGKDRERER